MLVVITSVTGTMLYLYPDVGSGVGLSAARHRRTVCSCLGSHRLDGSVPGQFCFNPFKWLRLLFLFLLLDLLHHLLSSQLRCADDVALHSGQLIVSCDLVLHLSMCECYGLE